VQPGRGGDGTVLIRAEPASCQFVTHLLVADFLKTGLGRGEIEDFGGTRTTTVLFTIATASLSITNFKNT
jgi:hypothetical protein